MAGAGFKTFVDGNVLTASEVNTYLMQQAVMVFADASARSTAIAAPSEGMVTYLTGSDVLEYYDGAAWQPILDQDVISAKGDLIVGTADDTVQALTVGSNEQRLVADSGETTGLKYVADTTNYAIGAKGDLLVGTAADTLTNLAVGTDDYVLTADSNEASGVKWAPGGGGGKVLQVVSTTLDTTVSVTTENDAATRYADVTGLSASITPSAATSKVLVMFSINGAEEDANLWGARVTRDGTAIGVGASPSNRNALGASIRDGDADTNVIANLNQTVLDSPASTSSLTYQVEVSNLNSAAAPRTVYVNRTPSDTDTATRPRTASTITLMEIGA